MKGINTEKRKQNYCTLYTSLMSFLICYQFIMRITYLPIFMDASLDFCDIELNRKRSSKSYLEILILLQS